jgi:predicted nuclease with RNAse H fold
MLPGGWKGCRKMVERGMELSRKGIKGGGWLKIV